MRTDRLKKLATVIEQSEQFDQSSWFVQNLEEMDADEVSFDCLTPSCVAGHAIVLWGDDEGFYRYDFNPGDYAQHLLEVDGEIANLLFTPLSGEDPTDSMPVSKILMELATSAGR